MRYLMKTRLLIIIGLFVISAIVISYSYTKILFDEYYEIEITGLKDTYTTDEVYSFDYRITGIGDSCAKITVKYPDENGETLTSRSMPQCAAERNLRVIINQSSFQGPLGNIAIKIPGTYNISVTYEPVDSFLSATTTKQFEVIDDFDATYGGPGNRHPAFLGYEIPESCTEKMVKHLVQYSNMFFADDEEYGIEDIGLPENVRLDDFDICVDDLLKLREITGKSHEDIMIAESPEPDFNPIPEAPPEFIKIIGITRDQICNVITDVCDHEYFIATSQSRTIYGNYGIQGVSIYIKIENDELCYRFDSTSYTCEKWMGDNEDFKTPSKYELPEEPRTEPTPEEYLPATNSINKWAGAPIYKEQKENEN